MERTYINNSPRKLPWFQHKTWDQYIWEVYSVYFIKIWFIEIIN